MKKFKETAGNNIIRVVIYTDSIFVFSEKSYIIPKNENLLIPDNIYLSKKVCKIIEENSDGIKMDIPSWLFYKIPKTVIIS